MSYRTLCAALLLLAWALRPAPAGAQQPIKLKIEAGYEGLAHSNHPFPVIVTISNEGADVQAEVQIGYRFSPNRLSQRVDLPSGARKRLLMWATTDEFTSEQPTLTVQAGERILAQQDIPITGISSSVLLAATVSEQQLQTPELLDVLGGTQVNVARLTSTELPALDGLLTGLDVIMIGAAELSPEQLAALERWVAAGGMLLIDGTQVSADALGTLAPARPTGNADPAALGLPLASTARSLAPQGDGALEPSADAPLWAERSIGAGVVRISAVPLLALTRNSPGANFWRTPLDLTNRMPTMVPTISSLRSEISNLQLPGIGSLLLFLVLYVLLVGPANYFILRRLDKREWAWISIPAAVLLFTGVAYLLGFGLRGGMPVLVDVTVIETAPGAQRGVAHTAVGVAAARRDRYTFSLEQPSASIYAQFIDQFGDSDQGGLLTTETGLTADEVAINVGDIAQFNATTTAAVPVAIAGSVGPQGIVVKNVGQATIPESFLVRTGEYVKLDALAPGQERTIQPQELICCFQQPGHGVRAEGLAGAVLFGPEDGQMWWGSALNVDTGTSYALVVPSNTSAVQVSADRGVERQSVTITIVYLPEERP